LAAAGREVKADKFDWTTVLRLAAFAMSWIIRKKKG
jgi:hypothetical protein